ncbi:DUF6894 family protein [Sphingomonas qilianensis]|uniref:DUF6894 domain-containing protein n=1 Tax=Sphingomonas qilianensis TaxID=1736690 RepID=A0ABU9XPU0_9SPHN
MPLFHFDLADHVREPDPEGTVLPSVAAARIQAIVFAGEYLRDHPKLINEGRDFRVEVSDEEGCGLFAVRIELIEQDRLAELS